MKNATKLSNRLALVIAAAVAAYPAHGQAGGAPMTATERAATSAMVTAFKAHGEADIEQPACRVVQSWALCGFGSANGNEYVGAVLHETNGVWVVRTKSPNYVIGDAWFSKHITGGGVIGAKDLNAEFGIPLAVATQLVSH